MVIDNIANMNTIGACFYTNWCYVCCSILGSCAICQWFSDYTAVFVA